MILRERETPICCSTHLGIHWLILVYALTGGQTCIPGISGQYSNQLSYLARTLGPFFFALLLKEKAHETVENIHSVIPVAGCRFHPLLPLEQNFLVSVSSCTRWKFHSVNRIIKYIKTMNVKCLFSSIWHRMGILLHVLCVLLTNNYHMKVFLPVSETFLWVVSR